MKYLLAKIMNDMTDLASEAEEKDWRTLCNDIEAVRRLLERTYEANEAKHEPRP